GGVTCFLAALMGTQQNDIKRILAYSTISQLGYMVIGISVATASTVAVFHLFTHAFFKCLLFLCAGSVIVGMHHEQDIWKMGSLKNKMPLTFIMMGIGTFALAGVPPFSGYFSKDLILEWAWIKGTPVFWFGAITIALTTFYIFRLFFVVFLGPPRSDEAKHAQESPRVMLLPMLILSILSLTVGWPFIGHFFIQPVHPEHVPLFLRFILIGFLAVGALVAYLLYAKGPLKDPIQVAVFENRFYIDNFYDWLVKEIQGRFAGICAFVDRWVVDGFVKIASGCVWLFGFCLRMLQVGNIQAYAFYFGAGILLIFFLLLSK
ncbi:MAG: NADH-quinone oxidoreductase subunit L, partial [Chthoniobacterales bacterium]|nr:NADH-quinone oxidoreductase subunit L [Chthoniobacterales bacterium]